MILPQGLGRGRPLKAVMDALALQREQAELRYLNREQAIYQAIERFGEDSDPKVFMRSLAEITHMAGAPLDPTPDPATVKQRQLEALAYEYAGVFVEQVPEAGRFRIWDFRELVGSAYYIAFEKGQALVETIAGDSYEITAAEAAKAFHRFLIYVGLFEVAAVRRPCPEGCQEKEPGPCDTCGGLGWVPQSQSEPGPMFHRSCEAPPKEADAAEPE